MAESKNGWKTNAEVIVDLDRIRKNLSHISRQAGKTTSTMAVVKADAYGHGSVKVVRAIQDIVDWLAVNDVHEAIELREAGIELPILVFGVPEDRTASSYIEFDLTATVSRLSHFDILREGTRYHLNFDTGMRRIGFLPGEASLVKKKMEDFSALHCTGIYSHFATADSPDSQKAREQLNIFRDIRKEFPSNLLTHLSNTGGIFFYEEANFDMVRTGIGMYGYPPGETLIEGIEPALTWRSYLTQVKPVSKGDTVSYGARWQAPDNGFIGVVPVGYEDGLHRSLSGKIQIKIGDGFYPQVGIVTMNYFMVYLREDDIAERTPVEIINTTELSAEKMARKLGTISYEILTSISSKIPRRYF